MARLDLGRVKGDDGFSPTVETSKSGKVTTITITDEQGPHVATILDGEDGTAASGDMKKEVYDINDNGIVDNAEKVNNHTVEKDVPADAKFTDTVFSGDYNDLTNKPTIPDELSDLTDDSTHRLVTDTEKSTWSGKQDALTAGSNITISGGIISATDTTYSDATTSASGLMSPTDKTKLNGIAAGAEVNVQANWNETDTDSDSYIQNKPTIPAEVTETTVANWGFTKNTGNYSKPSGGIPSSDLDSSVQTSLGKADTALQSETYTGTITSVKMNGSTVASSGEADLGTVITQHQDISGKQDIMQYSTIPTASVDNLGKIVQYIGTTDNTYTNGCFYKCVSDGESTPTYSWENIDVQEASGGSSYTAGTNIDIDSNNAINCTVPYTGTTGSTGNVLLGHDIYNRSNGVVGIGNNLTIEGGTSVVIGSRATTWLQSVAIGAQATAARSESVAIGYLAGGGSAYKGTSVGAYASANHDGGVALGYHASTTKARQAMFGSNYGAAYIDEMAIYTSDGIKVMATQEFVTNYLTTLSTYDATKTQVLKNVSGTLTWVTEE